ncbi:MAG TPA: HK97-gp10 family putative phage morphogenesis protein [Acidimicrobiia bacterium]
MARRSRVSGVSTLRRKLRRVEPESTKRLRKVVESGLEAIARDARSMAPRDKGDLVDSIDVLLSRDGLTGVAGPGVKAAESVRKRSGSSFGRFVKSGKRAGEKINLSRRNKVALMQFYKGYWAEFGTKGTADGKVPPQPATPFMSPAYDTNQVRIRRAVQRAIREALVKAARGG